MSKILEEIDARYAKFDREFSSIDSFDHFKHCFLFLFKWGMENSISGPAKNKLENILSMAEFIIIEKGKASTDDASEEEQKPVTEQLRVFLNYFILRLEEEMDEYLNIDPLLEDPTFIKKYEESFAVVQKLYEKYIHNYNFDWQAL